MQAAGPAAPKRRLRQRARLLVQGIDAAPAAEQTETGFDAGRVAPRVQADRQSAVICSITSTNLIEAQGRKKRKFVFVVSNSPSGGRSSSKPRERLPAS